MVTRYRCSACGNLTRFDVVTSRTTRAYHHYSVGGELRVEDETVLDERVDEVTCRWCGTGTSVEVLDGDTATVAGGGDGSASAADAPGAS
ncbi:MAG TPA: hypothetical protein VFI47_12390 [Acidimicrobiales bacterium]|nr:hypothetical protein [Acidimicrobiales bacterium]